MPGQVQRTLSQALYDIANRGQVTASQQPGQVLLDVLAVLGGLTTSGSALQPATAASVTWLALGTGTQAFAPSLTALANEIARVPVIGSALTGASQLVSGICGAGVSWGWITEIGAFGGAASATAGSGTLYAYCPVALPYLRAGNKTTVVQWSAT